MLTDWSIPTAHYGKHVTKPQRNERIRNENQQPHGNNPPPSHPTDEGDNDISRWGNMGDNTPPPPRNYFFKTFIRSGDCVFKVLMFGIFKKVCDLRFWVWDFTVLRFEILSLMVMRELTILSGWIIFLPCISHPNLRVNTSIGNINPHNHVNINDQLESYTMFTFQI